MSDKDTLGNKSSERSDLANRGREKAKSLREHMDNTPDSTGGFGELGAYILADLFELLADEVERLERWSVTCGEAYQKLETESATLRARVKELEFDNAGLRSTSYIGVPCFLCGRNRVEYSPNHGCKCEKCGATSDVMTDLSIAVNGGVSALRARVKELREYGCHSTACATGLATDLECDCGWAELKADHE